MNYKAKSSAVRAAKKLHGDNWAEHCKIVSGADGFTVESLVVAADDAEAKRLNMIKELEASLKALKGEEPAKPAPKVVAVVNTPADAVRNTKSLGGRPIDPTQAKTRRSLATFLAGLNGGTFTVKQVRAKLKQKLQHVSNAVRWAEMTGLVERVDQLKSNRPGRRELVFKVVAVQSEQKAA